MDLRVRSLEAHDVEVALREPFGIAHGTAARAEILVVRVELEDGSVGIGEAAPFPAYNGETRAQARAAVRGVRDSLIGKDARGWQQLARAVEAPSARCAIETALLDAVLRRDRIPMCTHFGGASTSLRTDFTIGTGSGEAARAAAARIAAEGFDTIKVKVGGVPLADDEARLAAIARSAPQCALLLDANAALASIDHAQSLLAAAGPRVVLFEQPFAEDALEAMHELSRTVPIAADESAATVDDIRRIAAARAATVVNIKPMKSGLAEAIEMIGTARALGLGLMIGGMVESSLAMSVSAALAAGTGGFAHVDLDTPLWMIDAPFTGGASWRGPEIDLAQVVAGHGVTWR